MAVIGDAGSKSNAKDYKPKTANEVKSKIDKNNDGISSGEVKEFREKNNHNVTNISTSTPPDIREKLSMLNNIDDDEKFARDLEENFYKIDINKDSKINDAELKNLASLDGDSSTISKDDFGIIKNDGTVKIETPAGTINFPANKLNPEEGVTVQSIEESVLANNAIQLNVTDPETYQMLKDNDYKLTPEISKRLDKTVEGQSLKELVDEHGYEIVNTDNYDSQGLIKDSSANVMIFQNKETGVSKFMISGTNFGDLTKQTGFKDIIEDVKAEAGAYAKEFPLLNTLSKKILNKDLTKLNSDQLNAVTKLYDEYIQKQKDATGKAPDVDIVGFSLGGGLAQNLAVEKGENCIAFNPVTPKGYTDADNVHGITTFTTKSDSGFEFVSKYWQPGLKDPNVANNEFIMDTSHKDHTDIPIVSNVADILEGHTSVQPGAIKENVQGFVNATFDAGGSVVNKVLGDNLQTKIDPVTKPIVESVKNKITDFMTYLFSVDYNDDFYVNSK